MTNVFANTAPKLWELGYRAVPIRPETKIPSFEKWQGYVAAVPNAARQVEMLEKYGDHGIGVLLGAEIVPGLLLVAIDIDDDRLVSPVRAVFPNATVGKRGKKGETLFGMMPKVQKPKSTTLRGAEGLGNIDFLAGGRQTVLNPTLHPETGVAYTAVGLDLSETPPGELPLFEMQQIKLIGTAIGCPEIVELQSGQGTHDPGVALVAKLMRAKATDEQITSIVSSLLPPDYKGNSLDELSGWIKSAREKGFDEPENDESPNLTAQLVNMARVCALELFHDRNKIAYIALPANEGGELLRIDSGAFRQWLRHRFYTDTGKPVSSGPLSEAVATLEAVAIFSGKERAVDLRIAGDFKCVEIDIGRKDGGVVHIDHSGWRIAAMPTHRFLRGAGFQPLPDPHDGGDLNELKDLLALNEENFRLTVAFLVNALKPAGPYFAMMIEGEQGSGKSLFAQFVRMLVDPNEAMRMRLPERDVDLMIHAKEYRLLNFDNASAVKADMSDVLCSLATGGGVGVRRLYTNGEIHVMAFSRPFIINGITGYANRPDLLERAIPIHLPHIAEGQRRTEAELMAAFLEARPRILGALYRLVAAALRHHDDVQTPSELRMADAARWIAAAERDFDAEPGFLTGAVVTAQDHLFIERVNEDALVMRLRSMLSKVHEPIEDYMGILFNALGDTGERGLPRSSAEFSRRLVRLRPSMAKAGLVVELLDKNRFGRRVWIGSSDQVGKPGKPYKPFGT